ncbi:hypothetical protein Tco_0345351, partial [Tanacetum coccineum]
MATTTTAAQIANGIGISNHALTRRPSSSSPNSFLLGLSTSRPRATTLSVVNIARRSSSFRVSASSADQPTTSS